MVRHRMISATAGRARPQGGQSRGTDEAARRTKPRSGQTAKRRGLKSGLSSSRTGLGSAIQLRGFDRLSEMTPPSQDPALPDDLLVRLRRSTSPDLKALVQDFGRFFGLKEVRQMLRNPFVDGECLQELSTIRSLMANHPIQAAVARHFRTPEPVAMRFVPNLFWRELLEISVDVRIRAPVRRVAERYLVERLPRLTVGEKIALARRATAPISEHLICSPDLRVVHAVLANPRMTESALMPLLKNDKASPKALQAVSAHRRWGAGYGVRVALCRNPQTPFAEIYRLLPKLTREDLEGITTIVRHSGVVLRKVEELLEGQPGPSGAARWALDASEPGEELQVDAQKTEAQGRI